MMRCWGKFGVMGGGAGGRPHPNPPPEGEGIIDKDGVGNILGWNIGGWDGMGA